MQKEDTESLTVANLLINQKTSYSLRCFDDKSTETEIHGMIIAGYHLIIKHFGISAASAI